MIRVALLDDHPALRAGLTTVLQAEPGLVPVGAAGDAAAFWPMLHRTRPDLVLLDYHVPGDSTLALCHELKSRPTAPAVVMYSAYADPSLGVLARLAGADGVVHKGARAPELFETLRRIHGGEQLLPPLSPSAIAEVAGEVDADDRPLNWTPTREIAEVFHQDPKTVRRRIDGLLRDLAREPVLPTA